MYSYFVLNALPQISTVTTNVNALDFPDNNLLSLQLILAKKFRVQRYIQFRLGIPSIRQVCLLTGCVWCVPLENNEAEEAVKASLCSAHPNVCGLMKIPSNN